MNLQSTNDLSIALLAARRCELEAAMALYLAGSEASEPSLQDSEAAGRLVDVLLASLGESADPIPSPGDAPLPRHYYSRFGDGLSPVLKDIMGPVADQAFLARSIDGYWRAVRAASA